MDKLIINGPNILSGDIHISGSKNASLPIMAASLLTDDTCELRGVPYLQDTQTMADMLKFMGIDVIRDEKHHLTLKQAEKQANSDDLDNCTAPYDVVRKMRASICALGPLLAKRGKATISLPGGCVIGTRPVDLHLKGLKALGAIIDIEHGYVNAHTQGKRLKGANIFLGGSFGSSVLATCNIMSAACLAEGRTRISGAACEPEVEDLAKCLNTMGAKISGAGQHTVIIEGVEKLKGFDHKVIADRIEAGTYLIAGAMCGDPKSPLKIHGLVPAHLDVLFDAFDQLGINYQLTPQYVEIWANLGAQATAEFTTLPYPGFPTDLQAQMMALLSIHGTACTITEKVFPDRFMHVPELDRMGANITIDNGRALISAVKGLSAAPVMASDLRASAALVLAALVADGETEINRIYHLDRGYEQVEEKLRAVGATIRRE